MTYKKTFTYISAIALVLSLAFGWMAWESPQFASAATDVKNDASLSTSLVSYWELEESSGTRVDSHGSNDWSESGSIGNASAVQGDGADFESSNANEQLSIADASQSGLEFNGDFSISLWMKPESSVNFTPLMYKWESSRAFLFRFDQAATDHVTLATSNTGNSTTASGEINLLSNLSDGTTYHFVLTFDLSAGTAELWVDGVSQGTLTTLDTSIANSSATMKVGGSTSDNQYFDGLIDEYGVWSKVLSSDEISDLYNSGSGIPYDAGGGGAEPPAQPPIFFSWATAPVVQSATWTLGVIPDTQNLAAYNATAYNTLLSGVTGDFFIHLGDVVNNGKRPSEWQTATNAFNNLSPPGLIAIGNHDYDDDAQGTTYQRDSDSFNAFFSLADIQNEPWFVSSYPANQTDNTAAGIIAGGNKWLFLSLEFFPRQAAIDWAEAIIASTSPDRIILATHMYLTPDGVPQDEYGTPGGQQGGPVFYSVCDFSTTADCASGEELYTNFISNLSVPTLVLNGHDVASGNSPNGIAGQDAYARRTDGMIHQHLANYQNRNANNYNDAAFYREYTFTGDDVSVTTYNPVTDTYLTDPENQFTFSLMQSTPPPDPVYGCTDPTATNYDANADTDDGSCVFPPQYTACFGFYTNASGSLVNEEIPCP